MFLKKRACVCVSVHVWNNIGESGGGAGWKKGKWPIAAGEREAGTKMETHRTGEALSCQNSTLARHTAL